MKFDSCHFLHAHRLPSGGLGGVSRAAYEAKQVRLQGALAGHAVSEAMNRNYTPIPAAKVRIVLRFDLASGAEMRRELAGASD